MREGAIRTGEVAAAMAAVPRHRFAAHVDPSLAYENEPILLKRDARGDVISTISQPHMIAVMLEELAVSPGQRVLEIGTASGYNAALLATLAGAGGVVVSVELESELAERAAASLRESGFGEVVVVNADGREGCAARGPYDRIIVTAGAAEVSPHWIAQLVEGGRLVVPITGVSGVGVCRTYEKNAGRLELRSETPCAFVPLRSPPGRGNAPGWRKPGASRSCGAGDREE